MKKLLIALMLLCMTLSITSCNTIRGAGEDIGEVGDAVRDITD